MHYAGAFLRGTGLAATLAFAWPAASGAATAPDAATQAPPQRIFRVVQDTFACQDPKAVRALTDPDTARPQDKDWVNFFVKEGKCLRVAPSSDWDMLSAQGDLAVMVSHGRRSAPLFFRYDLVDSGHDILPPPPSDATAPAPADAGQASTPPPPPLSAAFTEGQAARRAWDEWFAGLHGDYRAGAEQWARQFSSPNPGLCWDVTGTPAAQSTQWQEGCLAAHRHALTSDVRRRSEPEYAQGWNSPLLVAPGPTPEAAAVAQQRAEEAAAKAEAARVKQEAAERKSAAFQAGLADRRKWEQWFAGFLGDYRAGAAYWYGRYALTPRGDCANAAQSQTWRDGCEMARRRLAPIFERRQSDPIYAKGWEMVTAAPIAENQ